MIDLGNISFLSSWVLDVILILISASACFYCALLSKRLKALNGLDSGVGASIVSLTDAIGKTHDAAREAQSATHETVETLRFLLQKCESMAPNIEASISQLDSQLKAARKIKAELKDTITPELETAAQRGRITASGLLQIVEAVQEQQSAHEKSLKLQSIKLQRLAQESLKQEGLKLERLRQEKLKQEKIKQEALKQADLKQEKIEQDRLTREKHAAQQKAAPPTRPVLVERNRDDADLAADVEAFPVLAPIQESAEAIVQEAAARPDGPSPIGMTFASNLTFLSTAKAVNA